MEINEILFWKVYRNIYINKLIFHRIFTINFEKNLNKILKCKKVHSLTSLIEELTFSTKKSKNYMYDLIKLFNFILGINDHHHEHLIYLNGFWQSKKKILKYLVKTTKSKKLYSLYYYNYYKLIKNVGINSDDGFKRLKSDGILKKLKLNHGENNKTVLDFIILFLKEIKWVNWRKNSVLVNKIIDTIIIITGENNENYEKTIQSIEEVNPKFKLLLFSFFKWHPCLKQIVDYENILIVNDSDIIDWLSFQKNNSFCNIRLRFSYKRRIGLVQYKNKGLEEYSVLKLDEIIDKSIKFKFRSIKWSQILNNPIVVSDYREKGFDEIVSAQDQCEFLNLLLILKNGKYELKNDGEIYFEFNPNLLKYLANTIKNDPCPNILIDFSNHRNKVVSFLCQSIFALDFITCKFICSNLELSSIIMDQLNNTIKTIQKNFSKKKDRLFIDQYQEKYIIIDNIKLENTIELIKFLINYFEDNQFKQTIINYIYKKLIQIDGVTIEQVAEIKAFIEKDGIQLEHSLHHSFYYLNIKSVEIIETMIYLKNQVLNHIQSGICCGGFCLGKRYYKYLTLFTTTQMIDIPKFTFEYIQSESFDGLIEYFKWFKDHFLSTTTFSEKLK